MSKSAHPDGRVMIVGAGGFIGTHLVRTLVEADDDVVAVVREAPESRPSPTGALLVRDLARPGFTADLPSGIDTVVHLAQSRHFREFPTAADDIFAVNVASVTELLDWAANRQVNRFILASSGGIYGHGESGFKEDDLIGPSRPLGYYLASKHAAELFTEAYDGLMTVIVLRFFFVYGPDQHPTMFLPRLVRAVAHQQPILLDGPNGIRTNPVHVRDAVTAVMSAMRLDESHKINVAGPDVMDLREIGVAIGGHLGKQPVFASRSETSGGDLIGDISRMEQVLGPPEIGLSEGIRELCDDFAREARTAETVRGS